MWDQVDENEGIKRLEKLKGEHWRTVIQRGSFIKRFLRTPQSAFEILAPIFNKANSRTALLLQQEMNDLGLQLRETLAGKGLYLELQGLVSRRQKSLEEIRTQLQEIREPEQLLLDETSSTLKCLEMAEVSQGRLELDIDLHRAFSSDNMSPITIIKILKKPEPMTRLSCRQFFLLSSTLSLDMILSVMGPTSSGKSLV